MNRGCLFVLSAPSGAGKTSLVKALRSAIPRFAVAISHTTRRPRPGEQHGQAYYFVERREFEQMISAGAFLEHARVFEHYYGTAKQTVEALRDQGIDVLLEIDWQGARQIKALVPDSVSIFILPPSRKALEERLRARGQDDDATIARRMRAAISEMSHYAEYDYLVVNDDFAEAVEQLQSIVTVHRLRTAIQTARLAGLIGSLLDD